MSESCSSLVVATVKTHRVVNRKAGMLPTQEGLCELLGDETELEKQADGAPAQAFGEVSGIVDGEVVELPGGVESALHDESVEVGVEAKRVAERLVGHDCASGNWFASRGGVELRDQVEDQSSKVGEQPLVVAKKDPEGLGKGEDELAMGEGKEQPFVEVLREQEGSLLAARRA